MTTRRNRGTALASAVWLAAVASGCASPYYADRGAMFGGVMGTGIGAIAGAAAGDPLAGAAIGAIAGTMTGAVAGGAIDEVEAKNRAEIAAQLGRPVPVGAVTMQDVIAMTQAGVREDVIATHVRNNGLARPLAANDLIALQQYGVSPAVVQAMQTSPGPTLAAAPVYPPGYPAPGYPVPVVVEPAPVIVQPYFYGPPPPPWRHRHCGPPPRPGVSWGVSLSSDGF